MSHAGQTTTDFMSTENPIQPQTKPEPQAPALRSVDLLADLVDLRTLERDQARADLARVKRDYKALAKCYKTALTDCKSWADAELRMKTEMECAASPLVIQSDINLWEWCKTAIRESGTWPKDEAETNTHLYQLDTTAMKLIAAHRCTPESERVRRLLRLAKDMLSTFREDDLTVRVTAERQETWKREIAELSSANAGSPTCRSISTDVNQ